MNKIKTKPKKGDWVFIAHGVNRNTIGRVEDSHNNIATVKIKKGSWFIFPSIPKKHIKVISEEEYPELFL